MVLKELEMKDRARKILVESVNLYPYNWSAWLDLTSLYCSDLDTKSSVSGTTLYFSLKSFCFLIVCFFFAEYCSLVIWTKTSRTTGWRNFLWQIWHWNCNKFECSSQIVLNFVFFLRMNKACSNMMSLARNSLGAVTFPHNRQLQATTWEVFPSLHSQQSILLSRVWWCGNAFWKPERVGSTSLGKHGHLQQHFICKGGQSEA